MQCIEATDKLLASEQGLDPELERHVATCARCAHVATGLERVDAVLASTLVVTPPLDLQRRLAQLAVDAAQPAPDPWWRRLAALNLTGWLAQRPQMVAAQGLAAVMLALASWQIFGWLSVVQPVLGDVTYAMELVAASPAVTYLGTVQIDLQSLGIWSVVGIAGWLVSEDGLIGRRIAASGLRLP
jgi:anti-sigma factor RsiW